MAYDHRPSLSTSSLMFVPKVPNDDKWALGWLIAGTREATSYYLHQLWPTQNSIIYKEKYRLVEIELYLIWKTVYT